MHNQCHSERFRNFGRRISFFKKKVAFSLFSFFFFIQTNAQCAMCRAVLESEENQSTAKGINNGIIYLMTIPYVLVIGVGVIIYWKFFKTKKAK